jgi:protein TonB
VPGAVSMSGDAPRQSAALATSLALHVAIAVLVVRGGVVHLALSPTPILLTLVTASDRTAGPGSLSSELQSAAPAAAQPAPPPPPAAVEVEREEVAEPEPVPIARPKPVVKKAVAPAKPPPSAPAETPAPALATGSGTAVSSAAESGSGRDARSMAPAWAPTARVRYEELLFAWMNRHKQYPMLAQRRGLQGRGSVRVRIDRDGRVLERSLTRSTGEAMLDQAALDMVRRASPFPPVPEEYAGASFEFVAPIEYRLR